MSFEKIKEGLQNLTELTALDILSKKMPLDSLDKLNEPIDMYCLYAKDAPADGLDKQQSEELKKKTGWPDSIIDEIRSEDEAQIYQDANLKVESIEGKDCLVRTDIDYNQEIDGETNLDRMKQGKCPYSKDGEKIELHHIGQNPDAPLAELTTTEHRGSANDMTLHDKTIDESKINREAFRSERENYWKARAAQIEEQRNG